MNSSPLEIGLFASSGLLLFLYSVNRLALALRQVAGPRVQDILHRFTRSVPLAILTGTVVTTLLDSSSVVIILAIALVSAGALPFRNSLGVVLGANIGTTISSQLFAFDLGQYAAVAMLPGLLLLSLSKKRGGRTAGRALFCFGLLFFSLFLLGEAAAPLKDYPGVQAWLLQLETPLRGAGAGALLTLLIQSSSATLGMAIKLADKGLLTLPAGIAVMLGAELGTCSDTLLATLGRGRPALKTGLFHLFFNVLSIALGLLLIGPFTALVLHLADGTHVARQLAHAHVLFNVGGVLLFAPLLPLCQRLLDAWLPDEGLPAAGARPQVA
ncbi:Na/Pi cotransporter family protein [Hymenobacter metallicola]|uniref:Na/Pi cotransporter family protein n=1 Tax=Hymenobacter metallicola TaxID=2563114 RepID=A0A4Z0QEZ3_9BACT|nr:Na/Pi symporter [Hymenobacter metallicola]TGE28314.1 Na/Pi cotransporter family protein [Hymenobacter metallicola]